MRKHGLHSLSLSEEEQEEEKDVKEADSFE